MKNIKSGPHQGQDPVILFNRIAGLSDQVLTTKDLIESAIRLRVYNLNLQGMVMEGDVLVAKSKEELLSTLCLATPESQTSYMVLESKVADKNKLKV